jgi:hypothetical protein
MRVYFVAASYSRLCLSSNASFPRKALDALVRRVQPIVVAGAGTGFMRRLRYHEIAGQQGSPPKITTD